MPNSLLQPTTPTPPTPVDFGGEIGACEPSYYEWAKQFEPKDDASRAGPRFLYGTDVRLVCICLDWLFVRRLVSFRCTGHAAGLAVLSPDVAERLARWPRVHAHDADSSNARGFPRRDRCLRAVVLRLGQVIRAQGRLDLVACLNADERTEMTLNAHSCRSKWKVVLFESYSNAHILPIL